MADLCGLSDETPSGESKAQSVDNSMSLEGVTWDCTAVEPDLEGGKTALPQGGLGWILTKRRGLPGIP